MRFMSRMTHRLFGFGLCENVNDTDFHRNALIVYVALPFVSKTPDLGHQNQWQAKELAKVIGEFGFNVDVIDFTERVRLKKKYDLVVDVHPGLNSSYVDHMTATGRRIAYITGSNPSFSNAAEMGRIEELHRRKGKRLQTRRQAKLFSKHDLESCDGILFIGNSYNMRTYTEFTLRNIRYISNTGHDFLMDVSSASRSPRSFLFLGSGGQVHKGLDLLLEFFSKHDDLELYVCSSFKSEEDFSDLYHKELFEQANVHAVGFVDIRSAKFREICGRCSYIVLPSCSEANAGSVLTGMSAGLIPLVSRECGFEEDEVHFFDDCSCDSISRRLTEMSLKTVEWVTTESERAISTVRTRYSADCYRTSARKALSDILELPISELSR
jgi:hypothetical protein